MTACSACSTRRTSRGSSAPTARAAANNAPMPNVTWRIAGPLPLIVVWLGRRANRTYEINDSHRPYWFALIRHGGRPAATGGGRLRQFAVRRPVDADRGDQAALLEHLAANFVGPVEIVPKPLLGVLAALADPLVAETEP